MRNCTKLTTTSEQRVLNRQLDTRLTYSLDMSTYALSLQATTLPERPGSQHRHILQAPKDVFVCSVLIYVQRIRGFTTMRYINLRFTYLLTYISKVHCCLYYNGGLEDQSPNNNMGNGVNSFLKYLKRVSGAVAPIEKDRSVGNGDTDLTQASI